MSRLGIVAQDMLPNRRLFLNIVATNGRNLYSKRCGLFISRQVMVALGKTDFGLYDVVGGMTGIALLASAVRMLRGGIAVVERL